VALKLLNADRAADPSFEQSVIAEGRRLARLRHPNVIDVYGADTHEGRVGFWMEFLEGQTLKQWVDVHGPMELARGHPSSASTCVARWRPSTPPAWSTAT
jgi:serine/threonine protein kinase